MKKITRQLPDRLSLDELFDSLRATSFKTTSLDFFDEIKNKFRRLNNKTLFALGQESGVANAAAQNNSRAVHNIFKAKKIRKIRKNSPIWQRSLS